MECIAALTKDQKIAFIQAFVRLAHADGNVDEAERKYIRGLAGAYGLTEDDKDEILSIKDDASVIEAVKKITSKRAALELIKEMCVLAHADETLTDDETLFIGKVGQAMGVSLDKIEQISSWVIDRIIWLQEGKLIFEDA